MPIEEKPQLLEFNCTIVGMEEVSWNIKYDPNDKVGLHISGNGQTFHCPVELFGDVTAFLQIKNIIQPDVRIKSLAVPMPSSSTFSESLISNSLKPPQIDGQELSSREIKEQSYSGPPMDALASFDIGATPVRKESETEQPVTKKAGIKIGETKIKPKDEVFSRRVIRTRVNNDDPMSAEKEAAILRGQGAAGNKKTIKKKHQIVD